ncbi:hypothetical protein HMF8227_01640 [Saliniradius amylolyticus]|uniref:HNH domain-containing protein n=1 Tax=Saliniradius amylolyticus TaxID=2183582 RepID=A0A2S2E397_9ALTE|nr:hypothetical protein [Saliniradius amylolyticus]AWL12113.1 hypothetical protein HMF8227_01640 [Saliniradius amylolyticus]
MNERSTVCALCGRATWLTFHHLIPKKVHRRKRFRKSCSQQQLNAGIWVCRPCHSAIHRFIDEMSLAKNYASLEALKTHPMLVRHCQWQSKQRRELK